LKLAQLGISAIRACDAALDRIEDVKSGKYRFGAWIIKLYAVFIDP